MSPSADLAVIDNGERHRFEGYVDGRLAGVIEYIPLPGKVIATHTEVLEEHKGRGVGSRLVRGMVDVLRTDGRLLQPLCPYVTDYLRQHPEDADVVDPTTPR